MASAVTTQIDVRDIAPAIATRAGHIKVVLEAPWATHNPSNGHYIRFFAEVQFASAT